jgi:AcrR family transcriptional regulator
MMMGTEQRVAERNGSREAQRRRTRRDLIDATQGLLRAGVAPTIDDIAAAADVSRRTVYTHFPTLDQLLLDASVGLLSVAAVDDVLDGPDAPRSAADRVEALVRSLWSTGEETLPLGRQIIRLTVCAEPTEGQPTPKRGYRRIGWIEKALAPAKDDLNPSDYQRLVDGLSVMIGWEAMTVLDDVLGRSREEQVESMAWAARALVEAAVRR